MVRNVSAHFFIIGVTVDLSPLKNNRDFRYLYFGQLISFIGSMITFVAIPYQIYALTNSTMAVGMISLAELIPLLITALIGGAYADTVDRCNLILIAEIGLSICTLLLALNALLPHPHVGFIYFLAAINSAIYGIHRPSLDALGPRLVQHHEIQAMSILTMFKSTVGMIGGPALAGILIGTVALSWVYLIDFATLIVSIIALLQIRKIKPLAEGEKPSFKRIKEAFQYAISRQELMGTYVVDFMAMVFAMPNALFPAIAHHFASPKLLGWLYSAPAIGALIATVFSRWTHNVHRHGAAVMFAAIVWGLSIVAVGASYHIFFVLLFLGCAGAADCVSGIFRTTMWNETIPDKIRGRMSSLEMISYMSGPLLGNAQAGAISSFTSPPIAFMIGGSLCVVGVLISTRLLPGFWRYKKEILAPI